MHEQIELLASLDRRIKALEQLESLSSYKLVLDQGAGDGKIISFRSSDFDGGVTQGMTDEEYGYIQKFSSGDAGLLIKGASDLYYGLALRGSAETANDTTTTAARGPIELSGQVDNGDITSGNVVVMRNNTTAHWIMKDDGEIYSNFATAMTAFPDTENDMALISTIADTLGGNILKSEWDDFVTYNKNDLARLDIVTETGFVNKHNMTKLFIGAFRQEHAARREMEVGFEQRIAELEAQLKEQNDTP